MVAGRADFLGARNLFRRNVRSDHALDNSATLFADQHSCGLKSALRRLRLCRAALYRRIAFCGTPARASVPELSDALPIRNRRYGRLQICATWSRGLPNRQETVSLSLASAHTQLKQRESRVRQCMGNFRVKTPNCDNPRGAVLIVTFQRASFGRFLDPNCCKSVSAS